MIKETRGRPRLDPEDKKGAIRGARVSTIKRFKELCQGLDLDPGVELNRLMNESSNEMTGLEGQERILYEEECRLKEKLIDVKNRREKIRELMEEKNH